MINSGDAELNEALKHAESITVLFVDDGKGRERFCILKEHKETHSPKDTFVPLMSAQVMQIGRNTTLRISSLKGDSVPEDLSFDKICGIITREVIEVFGFREKVMWLVKDRQIVRFVDNS